MMRRKKTEDPAPEKPTKFWPVPGVDGEPYPPLVQEALDLVEKETRRRKIRECKHEGRYPSQRYLYHYGGYEHECGCRSCGAKGGEIACLRGNECNPEVREARKSMRLRTPAYGFPFEQRGSRLDIHVERQIRRVTEQLDRDLQTFTVKRDQAPPRGILSSSAEVFMVHNALGEPVIMVPRDEW